MTAPSLARHVSTRVTSQSEPIPGKPMTLNSAGGYSFVVDDWTRLDRFITLGSAEGSYYVSEKMLTVENAQALSRCLVADPVRTVNRIVEISEAGRAPKNDPAIFALAFAAGHKGEAATLALAALPRVCRTGTHFFQFVEAVEAFRGHGRALNRALRNWYLDKEDKALAYQMLKYQQRNGWAHRDVLRLCRPKATGNKQTLFHWAVKGWPSVGEEMHPEPVLRQIWAFERLKGSTDAGLASRMIRAYDLTREMIPTELLTSPVVWEALLEKMPLTALVRNLATMTRIGLVAPMSEGTGRVLARLADGEALKKSRVHPITILMALKTYASGHGEKGKHSWTPVPQVIDALDNAFYAAFANVEPTGKRWMLGIDVSHSMVAPVAGTSMSCCEGATALALVTAHTEQQYAICAFDQGLRQLPVSSKTRLDDALTYTRNINGGGTDCSMPMVAALESKIPVDAFLVLTDNETWAGRLHPVQALQQYREKTGIPAKLIVCGMVANQFTIADPDDSGMLDCVGWDSTTPQIIADFVR